MEFDKIEFNVLKCCKPDGIGYYNTGECAVRAEKLMEEGIIETVPRIDWWQHGWNLTEKGIKYREEFMLKLQQRHGHVWKTHRDSRPKDYKKGVTDEYADLRDDFVLANGNHNGPGCKNCGYEFCEHCTSEFDIPECTKRK